jgi:hypothetical protein
MTARPIHLFISESDGALFDTRVPFWYNNPPLRANYRCGKNSIESIADLKTALRYGEFAWSGGYQLYFLCSDGEAMSFDSVRENLRLVMEAIRDHDSSGWRVVAVETNWEDTELYCAHSGKLIPCAYGDDETESAE